MSFVQIATALLAATGVVASPFRLTQRSYLGFDYNTEKVRGVNLGGWFVSEPFITPSLYNISGDPPIDEYHLAQALGSNAQSVLSQHWNTWYTADDFATIASYGLNHVRIPIGYWAFQLQPGDPYVQGQEPILDNAIEWARNNGLKVWIDIHGAPGSQNGFDNSGQRDVLNWQNGDNVQATLDVVKYVAQKYGQTDYNDVVVGIELVNEPLGPSLDMSGIEQYYNDGWSAVRDAGSDTGVVIHDAFQPLGFWNQFMTTPNYWNVVLDHHQYQVFSSGQLQMNIGQHIAAACSIGGQTQSEYLWRVTGEWSAALTDCTPWLNGVGRGSRYEGQYDGSPWIGSCAGNDDEIPAWPQERQQNTRRFIEAQMDAYDQGTGWIFWTFKTEQSPEWDLRRLVDGGLFPQPLTDRQYPNQCNF
ncbi:Exg1p [Sugiyamaella lignohabitans]|uniref:glucan 1,3-beta-glucosidase n=1 Tax=Sugiyamaella lignohabitans TaxID=796027 RepID=A0A167DCD0_9ASCO|nr:Exg1p [Sugiyamaella lignohabitans]ANB12754.1 Exg1p [Sugiyamaella lignohabitans]